MLWLDGEHATPERQRITIPTVGVERTKPQQRWDVLGIDGQDTLELFFSRFFTPHLLGYVSEPHSQLHIRGGILDCVFQARQDCTGLFHTLIAFGNMVPEDRHLGISQGIWMILLPGPTP